MFGQTAHRVRQGTCVQKDASSPGTFRAPSSAFSTSFAVNGEGSPWPLSRRAANVVASAATSSAVSSCSRQAAQHYMTTGTSVVIHVS